MAALRIFSMRAHRRRHPAPRLFRQRVMLDDIRDIDIVARYRLDRSAISYIHDLLYDDLIKSNRGRSIDPITKILVSLRYLAKGDFYSEVGDLHGVSRSSVSRMLDDFLESINLKLDNIRFPTGTSLFKTMAEFYTLCGLPNIAGAVDGTLVPIHTPVIQKEAYFCRKGYTALNVQAVVDHNLRFTSVVARWPGSVHDAAIFERSAVKEYLEDTRAGTLLGDSGYPLKEFLLTPILRPTCPAETLYNEAHTKGRVVVERAFGLLKTRFRCLHKTGGCLPFSPGKCAKVVQACMRLHNLCIDRGLTMPDNDVAPEDDDDSCIVQSQTTTGIARRQAIVEMFRNY